MSDGADLGYKAKESMEAILGGEQPKQALTPIEMERYLEAAPDNPDSYDDVARWAGRGVLRYLHTNPEAIDFASADALFDGAFPRADDGSLSTNHPQLDGISGFMVGWAVNAALYAYGVGPVNNPAIIDL